MIPSPADATKDEILAIDEAARPAIPQEALAPLLQREDAPGIARLAAHLTAIVSFGLFVGALKGTLLAPAAMIIEGILLAFLFAPLHECIHRTAFKSRALNDGVGFVIGVILLLPRDYFRAFHFAHHRHTQDPSLDPELLTPKPRTVGQYLFVVSGLGYWRSQISCLARHALGVVRLPFLLDAAAPARIVREARIAVGLYAILALASVAMQSTFLLWFWIGPMILGQPFLRLFLLAEHSLCPLVPDMLKNSRTTITNSLMRFFAWNMPYHAEHHAYPGVPFHRLPDLHAILSPFLGCVGDGYLSVNRDIVRGLKA